MNWARILAYVTGTVNQELLLRNEYLAAENRITDIGGYVWDASSVPQTDSCTAPNGIFTRSLRRRQCTVRKTWVPFFADRASHREPYGFPHGYN
jgi:hypothetical protein